MQYLVAFGAQEATVQTAAIFLISENKNTCIPGFMFRISGEVSDTVQINAGRSHVFRRLNLVLPEEAEALTFFHQMTAAKQVLIVFYTAFFLLLVLSNKGALVESLTVLPVVCLFYSLSRTKFHLCSLPASKIKSLSP
jgi:hypothetical protein